jgi:hypothetical protein
VSEQLKSFDKERSSENCIIEMTFPPILRSIAYLPDALAKLSIMWVNYMNQPVIQ